MKDGTPNKCLGALFTSFSFDPAFFEEHVLRTVLSLSSDPEQNPYGYYEEAKSVLQKTPVVAIVDARQRQAGRRLPFDLLQVSATVFHPKLTLLLYEKFARVMIGSGNITKSGYCTNAELFIRKDLYYSEKADAVLLHACNDFIERISPMVREEGSQFKLFKDELKPLLPKKNATTIATDMAMLDSTLDPIMDQIKLLLPNNAVIHRIGMMAPFLEQDDSTGRNEQSVFKELAPYLAKDAVLDVGLAWDKFLTEPDSTNTNETDILENGIGSLWTSKCIYENSDEQYFDHLTITGLTKSNIKYIGWDGKNHRKPLKRIIGDIKQGYLWKQQKPEVKAPKNSLKDADAMFSLRIFLYPAIKLDKPDTNIRQPLHAKLMVISYTAANRRESLVVIGSPNMSRRALLMKAAPGKGNVELAVAFRISKDISIIDFSEHLTYVPKDAIEICEQEFNNGLRNYALTIESAIFNPELKILTITWSSSASDLTDWKITYVGQTLIESRSPPDQSILINDFILKLDSAELYLCVTAGKFCVDILVTDLIALPPLEYNHTLKLEDLLRLHQHYIGEERILQIAKERQHQAMENITTPASSDARYTATAIFKSWWNIASKLKNEDLSLQGLKLEIHGEFGVKTLWKLIQNEEDKDMSKLQIWFYGAELLRELRKIEFQDDRKNKELNDFCSKLHDDLHRLRQGADMTRPWVKTIFKFYGE